MSNDIQRVLHDTTEGCLAAVTKVPARTESKLREVRDAVRSQIRAGFGSDGVLDSASGDLMEAVRQLQKPKFHMQGSFDYRTHVYPPMAPPQQVDLDDGLFLPVDMVSRSGSLAPQLASDALFKAVELAIMPLCTARKWKLVTDKPSCVRIIIADDAHMDIALYAVPNEEFQTIMERAESAVLKDEDDRILFEDQYILISTDKIMLAHRDDGWIPSDPRKLKQWFLAAKERHGDILKRVCRFLKNWRDNSEGCSGLSSIALMGIAVSVFDEARGRNAFSNDGEALRAVATKLPSALTRDIPNPVIENEPLNKGWSDENQKLYVEKAIELAQALERALEKHHSAADVLNELTDVFGSRVTDEPSRVVIDPNKLSSKLATPAIVSASSVAAVVREEYDNATSVVTRPYFIG